MVDRESGNKRTNNEVGLSANWPHRKYILGYVRPHTETIFSCLFASLLFKVGFDNSAITRENHFSTFFCILYSLFGANAFNLRDQFPNGK